MLGSLNSEKAQKDLRSRFASVFTSSAVMKRNCPNRTTSFYMRHSDIPGPRARPFNINDVPVVCQKGKNEFAVCEKTDGVRMMLFIPSVSEEQSSISGGKQFRYVSEFRGSVI